MTTEAEKWAKIEKLLLPKEWTIRSVKMQTLFIIQSIPSVVDLNKYKINHSFKLNSLILTVGSISVNNTWIKHLNQTNNNEYRIYNSVFIINKQSNSWCPRPKGVMTLIFLPYFSKVKNNLSLYESTTTVKVCRTTKHNLWITNIPASN